MGAATFDTRATNVRMTATRGRPLAAFTSDDEESLVLTPGGPRPGDRVHQVGPREAVRGGESRTYSVVEAEPRGEADLTDLAEDLVLTPGGYRPRRIVHPIEHGQLLRVDANTMQLEKRDLSGALVANLGALPVAPKNPALIPPVDIVKLPTRALEAEEGVVPALASGWIAYAGWFNTTGQPISSFRTTWTVPPPPATQSGQTIFLFNGIQDSIPMIYQPVLQWGPSAAGGGNSWMVASWYVGGAAGAAFFTPLVPVNVGDELVGVMTLTARNGTLFDYNCEFQGIPNTSLPIQNVPELTWANETLEAYSVSQCSDYPATAFTGFRGIDIQTGATRPAITWTPVDNVVDCTQHAAVVSNANPNGDVDIYYRFTSWRAVNVSQIAGPRVAGPATSWQTPNGPFNVEHLAAPSPSGDLLVFWWSPQHDWQSVNVSQIAGPKVAGPATSWQTPGGGVNVEHLAAEDPNGDLHVFWWSPAHDWQAVNVSQITGQKIVGPATSWQTPNGPYIVEHLAAPSPSGDLHVFWWSPQHDWQAVNVSQFTGQRIAGPATSWQTANGPFNVEHLAAPSPSGDLLVFWWSPQHDWQVVNVSQITGQRVAGPATSWQTSNGPFTVEHLAAPSPSGDLLVFWWSPQHDWQAINVSQIAGSRVAGPATSWQADKGFRNEEHLAAASPVGDLLDFWWSPQHDWQAINISQLTGQRVAGPATSWQTSNGPYTVEHLAAASPVGDLLVFFR